MTAEDSPKTPAKPPATREERLAKALRTNLRRRKGAAGAGEGAAPADPDKPR